MLGAARSSWPSLAMTIAVAASAVGPARAAGTADETLAPGTAATEVRSAADRHPAQRPHAGSGLDRRVHLLAVELGLDATQQKMVRALLEDQREQIARVWNDASVPAAVRVGATQAVGDRTAEQIRSLLTDEQRSKYIQPRQRDVAVGTAGSNVESWMNVGKPKANP